ncbi:ester cyclase [Cytophagaceae bacterium DM2B3-1]|uniref:Ester cyclase n=1 Tax=Xanthocytophaga flava TaxID=3048013 RepID=A0ABT7CZ23_9BACT|nr:ester cyclase [Xanthocytophaga flavus]MDJ1473630.1 ester cyclase [Xanthocytophaga flavus]MDJ1498926.1 ester cyclase [Xanthocytophaga flavus]
MQRSNKTLITDFIEQIWNVRQFDVVQEFLHPDFVDHSLPDHLPAGKEGMLKWIQAISFSFEHTTLIDDQVTENDKSVIKVRMKMKHVGLWRDIPATYKEVETVGYRLYRLADGKIIEHWGLLDGHSLENQLRSIVHGCKIAE